MTNRTSVCAISLLVLLLAGCGSGGGDEPAADTPAPAATTPAEPGATAAATIESKSGSSVTGEATFAQYGDEVRFELHVNGASPGEHAVHLHETGDCSSDDGKSAGGHWNPTDAPHGRWGSEPFHLGDVGNMTVDDGGHGTISLETDRWTIGGGGANDVLGKAVIVHAGVDDFATQPTGAAGGRIGCGVITSGS